MSFWDYLTAGKKYRDTDDDYSSSSSRHDYSNSSSRPKRISYRAYCRNCGANTSYSRDTPGAAIRDLQFYSNGCGKDNHFPQIQEIEE